MPSEVTRAPRLTAAAAILVLAALAGAAWAAEFPEPSASYSGDGVMTTDMGAVSFRVFADGAIERREMTTDEATHVVIKRPDRGVAYLLVPEDNMAMEIREDVGSMPASAGEMAAFNPTPVGSEAIAGETATKYALSGVDARGAGFDGFAWLTDDGILLKLEGTSRLVAGRGMPMTVELTSLARGPQDPSLFELPAGVAIMRLDGLKGNAGATPARRPGADMPRAMPDMESMEGMEGMPDVEALRRQLEQQMDQLERLQGDPANQ